VHGSWMEGSSRIRLSTILTQPMLTFYRK
jgi:hypothetical protein